MTLTRRAARAHLAVVADERHGENVVAQLQRFGAADTRFVHARQISRLFFCPHFDLKTADAA